MKMSLDSDGSRRKPAKHAGRATTTYRKPKNGLQMVNLFHNGLTLQQKKYLIGALTVFNLGIFGATVAQDNQTRVKDMHIVQSMVSAQPDRNNITIKPVEKPEAVLAKVDSVQATPTPTPTPTPKPTTAVAGASISRTISGSKTDWMRAAGIPESVWGCVDTLVAKESGWRVNAYNASSGAYGLPQALPGSKMATVGADWQTNPVTQLKWMYGYVNARYGGFCEALSFQRANGWY